jgi:hypothetical protein
LTLTYLEAVKLLAHKAGFDEVVYKDVVSALVHEHGTAQEKKQIKEWAIGKEVSDQEAAYEAEVDRRIAARKSARTLRNSPPTQTALTNASTAPKTKATPARGRARKV